MKTEAARLLHVDVVVFATLRNYMPELAIGETKRMDVPHGTTVEQLIEMLEIPVDEVKVMMRNHRQADLSDVLAYGDRIALIPAVGGG